MIVLLIKLIFYRKRQLNPRYVTYNGHCIKELHKKTNNTIM